jgi:predicted AAA+ superfamily ATPase
MDSLFEQTIVEQNPHWQAIAYEHSIHRLHDDTVLSDLELAEILIITGIRRCGKSTFLQVLINHLMQTVTPQSILYINFDDPNYTDACHDAKSIYNIVTVAEKLTQRPVNYLFLDEVQNVNAWEKYVKSVYDSKRFHKIVVTGSNADLLNSSYVSLLAGRYIETRLYPMKYKELLLNHGITDYLQLIKQKSQALRLLDKMLILGGFPRIHCLNDEASQRKLLKNYYETILLKDCIKNHQIRDTQTFTNLAYYLINHISSLYSYNSLSKAVESNENTIKHFIQILHDAYFINELKQYADSIKTQSRAKKKTYCIDNGLVSAVTFKFSHNLGKLLENLVYTELRKMSDEGIYFFNDTKECDFIVHHHDEPQAFQVCYELNETNRAREINGLLAAMAKFSIPQGYIITYDQAERINDHIQVIPFWQYFAFL